MSHSASEAVLLSQSDAHQCSKAVSTNVEIGYHLAALISPLKHSMMIARASRSIRAGDARRRVAIALSPRIVRLLVDCLPLCLRKQGKMKAGFSLPQAMVCYTISRRLT